GPTTVRRPAGPGAVDDAGRIGPRRGAVRPALLALAAALASGAGALRLLFVLVVDPAVRRPRLQQARRGRGGVEPAAQPPDESDPPARRARPESPPSS